MKTAVVRKVIIAGLDRKNGHDHADINELVGADHRHQILTNSAEPRSAGQNVLATTELLEQIMSYLPMKKIFNVQSVCWRWKNVINTSPELQARMWLRLKSGPKETWKKEQVKAAVKVWNDTLHPRYERFKTITPVVSNPELRHDSTCTSRNLGVDCMTHTGRVVLQWGPAQIRQHFSLLDAFITDPPCKTADICLTVHFHKPKPSSPKYRLSYPFKIWVTDVRASSETGLTFQDILRAALNARGNLHCTNGSFLPSNGGPIGYKTFWWRPGASLREAIGLLPKYTGNEGFIDCPVMEAKIILLDDVAAPTLGEWAAISSASR